MVSGLDRILSGSQVFRPLIWTPIDPKSNLMPGFNRGPNTIVFRPECLKEMPNAAPVLAGEYTRRSDMNWALLGYCVNGWKVVTAPFPVRHDRSFLININPLKDVTLINDIRGYAVFSALADFLLDCRGVNESYNVARTDLLSFTDDEIAALLDKTERYMTQRIIAWETNCIRVKALASALDGYVRPLNSHLGNTSHFWMIDPSFQPVVVHLSKFIQQLKEVYDFSKEDVSHAVLSFDRSELKHFFMHLDENISRFTV
jgi:hypothetical protein